MAEVQTCSLYPTLFLVSVLFNLIFGSNLTFLCDFVFFIYQIHSHSQKQRKYSELDRTSKLAH